MKNENKLIVMKYKAQVASQFPKRNPKWLQDEHNKSFLSWMHDHVAVDSKYELSHRLKILCGWPTKRVLSYASYRIDGVLFSTLKRDETRVTQNSGVSMCETVMQIASVKDKNPIVSDIMFYGRTEEIWELDYTKFQVVVFKYSWVDNNSGVKVDDSGFTLVNLNKVGYLSKPYYCWVDNNSGFTFILGSQAKQVLKNMVIHASDDEASESKDNKSTHTTRAKRGKVCFNSVAQRRAKGVIQDVDFNMDGQPVEKAASQLQSYIGLLVRDHVKISIKNWKLVSDDTKDLIWEQVKGCYNVPETWKAACLESANSKWRTWKCRMHKDFILPNKDNPDEMYKPPPDSGILDHDWGQLSEQQKKMRSKHLYPYRLSRKGYANYAEEIKDLHGDKEIDRCLLWKKARLNKKGATDNENLKIAIQKIDEYIREKEEGTLHSEATSSDLLSLALDKPEHAGRVRGKGLGVKPKSYFQSIRESRRATNQGSQALCNAELEEAKRKIEEQAGQIRVLDHVVHELKDKMEKFESKHAENDKESEGLASCSVMKIVNQEKHNMESPDAVCIGKSDFLQGKAVKLLYGVSKKLVAYGTVFVVGAVLHGSQMPPDCFRVSIDEVVDENAVLPFRVSDEIETVGGALGTHVAWPTHLVVARLNETQDKKKIGKKLFQRSDQDTNIHLSSLPLTLLALYCLFERSFKDEAICFMLDVEVFGHEMKVHIFLNLDVVPFCKMDPITGNCIIAYVCHRCYLYNCYMFIDRHLYSNIKENDSVCKFLFVNPFAVEYGLKDEDRSRALSERLLLAASDQLVPVPCNVGGHWILTIFQVEKNQVFFMDPLCHRNKDTIWKSIVDTALSIVQANKGKKFKKANWEVIKGPLQPDDKQYGYYVMRFMRDIITGFENATSSTFQLSSLFKGVRTYSQAQLNEVREEWAKCVIHHFFN
ncbi:hypothetical protein C2S52_004896 [Perilla frutescens var. hirtella]|nr:hypothetical protein C2S52_004896 [Perilla frutescens var. hirtella]